MSKMQTKLAFGDKSKSSDGVVNCLGTSFASEAERRDYYGKELARMLEEGSLRELLGCPSRGPENKSPATVARFPRNRCEISRKRPAAVARLSRNTARAVSRE